MRSRSAIRCAVSSGCGRSRWRAARSLCLGRRDLGRGLTEPRRSDLGYQTGRGRDGLLQHGRRRCALFRRARHLALSDNYRQPAMAGTGANFQALATAHAIAYREEGHWRSRRQTRSKTRTRATTPTTGTRSPAIRAARIPIARTQASPVLQRSTAIWRNCRIVASMTATASRAPITSSTTTMPASYPPASRRHLDRRCFAFRPKRSRR